ncbi:MAG: carbohydrate porin, partial [Planctomycetota bacterium]
EQRWLGDAFRLKIGKVDANSEFAYADAANEFINSSSGFSPTLFVFPTFPDPAVSVNLFLTPTAGVEIGVGVYNADDDGAYSGRRFLSARFDEVYAIAEAAFSWEHLGLARAGAENDTSGYYLVAEREIWRVDPDDPEDSRALRMFLQYGWADQDVSEFQHHVSLGLEHKGLFPCREIDTTGFMASYADLSDVSSAGFRHDETAFEVFHHFQVTPYLGIKPVLQYVVNPSGSQAIDDALVATIRFEVRL